MNDEGETDKRDTLYFNAFTEDLFSWDNDLDNDSERRLTLNTDSSFFAGLESMEMDNRIRALLDRYADFEFRIDTTTWEVVFAREFRVRKDGAAGDEADSADAGRGGSGDEYETRREETIKVSRGEENIFIWCFFLAIVELALDDDGTGTYAWVKYIYVDDPISSLDEHNAIAVANHLAKLLKRPESRLKTVISTHHTLFFNVLCNELNKANKYFLSRDGSPEGLLLRKTGDTPFFHHVAALAELHEADRGGRLYTHHFNMLRAILEKTASFHGYENSPPASNATLTMKTASFTHGWSTFSATGTTRCSSRWRCWRRINGTSARSSTSSSTGTPSTPPCSRVSRRLQ